MIALPSTMGEVGGGGAPVLRKPVALLCAMIVVGEISNQEVDLLRRLRPKEGSYQALGASCYEYKSKNS